MCSFHYILMCIRYDEGEIEVFDSLRTEPKEFKSLFDIMKE